MVILRLWRAEIRHALRDQYVEHVAATGQTAVRATKGNLGVPIPVRDLDAERSEIVVLSPREAIRALAGEDPESARYFQHDDPFPLSRPEHVLHHDASPSIPTIELAGVIGETT